MNAVGQTWVVVLAGGEGSRLRGLTTMPSGISVPKQFCSLRGGASLMEVALHRAQSIVARERIRVVVAAQHRCWWEAPLWPLPASNITVQPQNRGTAVGMLLPLLQLLHRDPQARIVWLPSDHHVQQEQVLAASMRAALHRIDEEPNACILLGMEPDEADPELGYVVPGVCGMNGVYSVQSFIEKPSPELAEFLIGNGALWNGFIIVAHAAALLRLFEQRIPEIVREMRAIFHESRAHEIARSAINALYVRLPTIDFSRDVAQGCECDLRVLRVPPCGWSDLGTPTRLAATLRRLPVPDHAVAGRAVRRPALDLSSQRRVPDEIRMSM